MKGRRGASTADRILDVAEELVQVRGFNAFSYADVAAAIGIRKASLHHHFATKAALGLALVDRYRGEFLAALDAIAAATDDARDRLRRYAALYGAVLRRRRMCLCGMLAADVATLPREMREAIERFFADNEAWLERMLEEGRGRGELRFEGAAAAMAAFVVSSLEGAMLVARGSGRLARFDLVAERIVADARPAPARDPAPAPAPAARRRAR